VEGGVIHDPEREQARWARQAQRSAEIVERHALDLVERVKGLDMPLLLRSDSLNAGLRILEAKQAREVAAVMALIALLTPIKSER